MPRAENRERSEWPNCSQAQVSTAQERDLLPIRELGDRTPRAGPVRTRRTRRAQRQDEAPFHQEQCQHGGQASSERGVFDDDAKRDTLPEAHGFMAAIGQIDGGRHFDLSEAAREAEHAGLRRTG